MRQPSRLRNRRPALAALLALAAAAVLLGARPAPAPGPDLAAEAANKPVEPPPETHAITEPARAAPDGLLAAYEEVGLLALLRAWPEMVEAPGVGVLGGPRAGLSPREWIGFYEGRQAFLRVYTVQEGLDANRGLCAVRRVRGAASSNNPYVAYPSFAGLWSHRARCRLARPGPDQEVRDAVETRSRAA